MTKDKDTMMRISKELLQELNGCREYKRESYADIVKRMIEKDRKKLK